MKIPHLLAVAVFLWAGALSAQPTPDINWNLTDTSLTTNFAVDCSGTTSYPAAEPGNGCQSYAADEYENWDPNVQGSGDTDLTVFRAGYDANFFYFETETRLTWNFYNDGTSRGYHFEIDTDSLSGGDARFEYYVVYQPLLIHANDTTWDAEGKSRVKLYQDTNNNVGGSTLNVSNYSSGTTGDGYEVEVDISLNAMYVRIVTRGGKQIVQVAVRASAIGSPNTIIARPWLSQTSTIDKAKMAWHDKNATSDLASNRIDNIARGTPIGPNAATAVRMLARNAVTGHDGSVDLVWSTSWEHDNLGFNVIREAGAEKVRVTPGLIAGSALIARSTLRAGFSYRWTDRDPLPGAVYWIEEIDVNGTRTEHGPIIPSFDLPTRPRYARAGVLDDSPGLGAFGMAARRRASDEAVRVVSSPVEDAGEPGSDMRELASISQADLASGPAAKLAITQEGYYRVTRAEIAASGYDPGTSAHSLALFADGREIPIAVNDGGDGRWDLQDSLEFYGVGMDTTYSGQKIYWLAKRNNGLRFRDVKKAKNSPVTQDSFTHTLERKDRVIYFGAQTNGSDTDSFVGPAVYSTPVTQTFPVTNLRAGTAGSVEVALKGATFQSHRVRVLLNGTELGTLTYADQQAATRKFAVAAGRIREGENVVSLTALDGDLDISFINYVRVTYSHRYAADADVLRFTVPSRREATVTGFSRADVKLLDITDPLAPLMMDASVAISAGAYSITASSPDQGERRFLAISSSRALKPHSITMNVPSTLSAKSNRADFVIISHQRFISALEPLVSKRRGEGFSPLVVDVQDVYDEFSAGSKSPVAIRDFLNYARRQWTTPPRYVLLVGDASFDPRDYLGYGDIDLVPTRILPTRYMKAASDDWLVDFDDDGVPNLYLGRLPIRTISDADAVVSKLTGYRSPVPSGLMVVDQTDDSTDFAKAAADITPSFGSLPLTTFQVTASARQSDLIAALNARPTIVTYIGHGSIEGWSNTSILSSSDTAQLANSASTPFYLLLNCLNAHFADVWTTSLGEALLRTPNGGALAVWASSALSDPRPQTEMAYTFLRQWASNRSATLGELAARAKSATVDPEVRKTWTLFGDPTQRLTR